MPCPQARICRGMDSPGGCCDAAVREALRSVMGHVMHIMSCAVTHLKHLTSQCRFTQKGNFFIFSTAFGNVTESTVTEFNIQHCQQQLIALGAHALMHSCTHVLNRTEDGESVHRVCGLFRTRFPNPLQSFMFMTGVIDYFYQEAINQIQIIQHIDSIDRYYQFVVIITRVKKKET